jgi:hypothetical protein
VEANLKNGRSRHNDNDYPGGADAVALGKERLF